MLFLADLQGANLITPNLNKAILDYAKMRDVKGLTAFWLLNVKTLYNVKGLDPEIEKELRTKKPELFDERDLFDHIAAKKYQKEVAKERRKEGAK